MTRPIVQLSAPPLQQAIEDGNTLTPTWGAWFTQMYNFILSGTVNVATDNQNMIANACYIANSTSLVNLTLPQSFKVGDTITVMGMGTGGWKIKQNALQSLHSSSTTTVGTGGSLASGSRYNTIVLRGLVEDLEMSQVGGMGTYTIV